MRRFVSKLFLYCRMRYISPARLLGESLTPPIDRKILQRERKRLLADLELSEDQTLSIHGQSLSRNEIIDYFEELQLDTIAGWHAAIGEDKVLLAFLEDGLIDEGTHFSDNELYDDAHFIIWLSPYFYLAFAKYAADCFELTDESSMRALMANRLLMTAEDTEKAWQSIANLLQKNISLFDHYHGKGSRNSPTPMSITKISAFIGHGYIQVIKQLPNSRFSHIKDSYAFSMQHPAIATFNRDIANRGIAVHWVEEARDLAVSPGVRDKIARKLEELRQLEGKRKKKKIPWAVVWIVLVSIRAIVALSPSGSSGYTPREPINFHLDSNQIPVVTPHKVDSVYADSVLRHSESHP